MNRALWCALPLLWSGCETTTKPDTGTDSTDTTTDTTTAPPADGYCATFVQISSGGPASTGFEEYDDTGRVLYQETDQLDDGDLDNVTTFAYTAETQASVAEYDTDGDGVREGVSRTVTSTIHFGLTIEANVDANGDGVFESDLTVTLESSFGDPLEQRLESASSDPLKFLHTYDAERRLVHTEIDFSSDGSVDDEKTFTYDDVARTMTLVDASDNGTSGFTRVVTSDAAGRTVLDEQDTGSDGSIDSFVTYTYDGDHLSTAVLQIPGAGYTSTTTFTYDAEGRLVSQALVDTAGNTSERTWTVVDCP